MTALRVHRLSPRASLPRRMSEQAAGLDLYACLPSDAPLALPAGGRVAVPTGISMAIPAGYEGQVRPRSGLAARHGVTVLNAPGTIDADYRGEVAVLLVNLGSEMFTIEHGDRIAQLVLARVASLPVLEVRELDATERGDGGFGSTGVSAPGAE
ncbi:MAG: dUTP diphosphatase [Nannocystaceae bacterium]|nr:dUTP diphosphatase [Nannocystaceae bacterium]